MTAQSPKDSPVRMYAVLLMLVFLCAFGVKPSFATPPERSLTPSERTALARDFLKRMGSAYKNAERFMEDRGLMDAGIDLRGMPTGELLIFEVKIPPRLLVEGSVIGEVAEDTVLISLRDFINVLAFPIEFDEQTRRFSGWYIRENKNFELDLAERIARSQGSEYNLNAQTRVGDDDVLASVEDLELWFNMAIDVDVGTQTLKLEPSHPLPATERFTRRNRTYRQQRTPPAELPRMDDDYDLIDIPVVDVSSRTNLRDSRDRDREITYQSNIRTAGEFAYGNLSTNITATQEDKITNVRASWLRESADPELLGPLKARRVEIGDIVPTRLPLTGGSRMQTGVRVTNTDPVRNQLLPTTQITGTIFPGWDVELYRNQSLLSFTETDDSGFYSFDNVQLFSDQNSFRVVAYGPQGEVREELVSVPYDPERRAADGGVYDVSVMLENRQLYQKFDREDEDDDTPHVVGFYELPVGQQSAVRLGLRSRQQEGEQKTYGSAGLSTSVAGALVNATVAADTEGEMGAEFVATKQYGRYNTRADLKLATEGYSPGSTSQVVRTLDSRLAFEGPLALKLGVSPRISAGLNYSQNNESDANYGGYAQVNTQFGRVGVNQGLFYDDSSTNDNGANIRGISSVSGSIGRNSIRGVGNYSLRPEATLDSLSAFWRYRLDNELQTQMGIDRDIEDKVNTYSAQLNWRPDYATISPRVSYNSEGDLNATLNMRFGLATVPQTGELIFTRDGLTSFGAISAFVYLDKDGDKVFNNDDEPIENARIVTPQNVNGAETSAGGIAHISQLRPNITTDVYLDQNSLPDPFWIAAEKGVSVMPRTGNNVYIEFPVHVAGEIDGTIYARQPSGGKDPVRRATIALYDRQGRVVQRSVSGTDGFYLFSLVPPGDYLMLVEADTVPPNMARPLPEPIQIGYDGTILYGKDIYLEAQTPDVPSVILASLDDYQARHPHIEFSQTPEVVLNLGDYNSNLMMALSWYKLALQHRRELSGGNLMVPPTQSYADIDTGKHVLRVTMPDVTLQGAYQRCRYIMARGDYCKVEVFPGYM